MTYRKTAMVRRRGIALIYFLVIATVLMGICSLSVDYGRVQLAKSELRSVADAAARAAASNLGSGVTAAQNAAKSIASANRVDDTAVTLLDSDIEFGTWDSGAGSFTVLTGSARNSANGVRINAQRLATRGTAIALTFGQLVGASTCDVHASAIASMTPVGYGVIGLDYIAMGGNTTTSYWSSESGGSGSMGNIASNGYIALQGSSYINGNANPGPSASVIGGVGRVSGSMTPLPSLLSFSTPGWPTSHNNSQIPNGTMSANSMTIGKNKTVDLPAGTYAVQDLTMGSNSTLNLLGPVTLYVCGKVEISGSVNTNSNTPKNFKIIMCTGWDGRSPTSVSVSGSSALYATIYAPAVPVTLSGTGDIYGSVLGKSISMTGSSAIHYDLALSGGGKMSLVK